MHKRLVIGNWKMQLTPPESAVLARAVVHEAAGLADTVQVVLCPSFTSLDCVSASLAGSSLALGAQDVFPAAKGPFTGMIGFDELRALGVSYLLLGHSERRRVLGETDEEIGKKFHGAIAAGCVPVLCVGETAAERAAGRREFVLERQLGILAGLSDVSLKELCIAYEPVWAISTSGSGIVCSPKEAALVHQWIREAVMRLVGAVWTGERIAVLYGGSVDEKNAGAFASEKAINGALVGGASLRKESFLAIATAFAEAASRKVPALS